MIVNSHRVFVHFFELMYALCIHAVQAHVDLWFVVYKLGGSQLSSLMSLQVSCFNIYFGKPIRR